MSLGNKFWQMTLPERFTITASPGFNALSWLRGRFKGFDLRGH